MSSYDLEKFVNREKELSLVREKVARLARGEPFASRERVVHFVGPSGIGKSFLLEKINAILMEESACVPVLIRLDSLKSKSKGKELIDEFLINVYQEFCRYQNLSVNTVLEKPSESRRQYSNMVVRAINLGAVDKVLVLLLDEINILDKQQFQGIEDHFLQQLIHANSSFVLVTAGRSYPLSNDFAIRPSLMNTFPLLTFDETTTGDQLEALKPGTRDLAGNILELGNGIPRHNTKLVERIIGDPPSIPDELQAIRSLLADVKKEIDLHFHPIIEAICILTTWDPDELVPLFKIHPLLAREHRDESGGMAKIQELKQIQIGPGGLINWDREKRSWAMDEPTRALFEKELKMRDPELWSKLHCTAYKMYEKWGDEFNSQLYRDKAAYHLDRLQSAGMNCDGIEG